MLLPLACFVSILSVVGSVAPPPDLAFVLEERDLVPEGITHDSVSGAFFLGSTYRRKIVRIDRDGSTTDFIAEGANGVWGVVGVEVDVERRVLWAASSHAGRGMPMVDMDAAEEGSSGLFGWNVETGRPIARHLLPADERHFLNDLTVTPGGDVYVTDSGDRSVYRRVGKGGEFRRFARFDDLGSPNGLALAAKGTRLYVALGRSIAAVDLANADVCVLEAPESSAVGLIDGLETHRGDLIAVQPFARGAHVARYHLSADGLRITRIEPLVSDHPDLAQPTTGVVVENEFYFVANSQLQKFRALFGRYGAAGKGELGSRLSAPRILRFELSVATAR